YQDLNTKASLEQYECLGTKQEKEVFVKEPPCFKDTKHLIHALKLKKTLYGLKQVLGIIYLTVFSFQMVFQEEKLTTLFKKVENKDFIIV
ncbi:hypothetical protein CR513_11688, partial [Mucuna pruriens]